MWFQSLGMKLYLFAPVFGWFLYFYLSKPQRYSFEDRDYTLSKWFSAIGLYFIALLVWFGYFQTENYSGIVDIFERLQKGYGFFSENDKILLFITFIIAIIFPIPTILALVTAFIAHSSIAFGVISFVVFSTVQYFVYLQRDTYFYMDDLLEWIKVLTPLFISILKIIF